MLYKNNEKLGNETMIGTFEQFKDELSNVGMEISDEEILENLEEVTDEDIKNYPAITPASIEPEKYRYDSATGELYEYSHFHGCYLFCCSNPYNLSESELIAEYEGR